jgi:cold shock CspA family protein
METGTIVELTERQSGFIRRAGVKEHLFFHADDLAGIAFGSLKKGQRVSFAVTESLKGAYATQVELL